MEEIAKSNGLEDERINKEAPQLISMLKEMKEGLDLVRAKVQALTAKVKANQFPTADGMNYLEAKHLLLLNYCQSIVYYLLRKAKGHSIEGHPVVRSLVEIRLFLEKIRPIDKKLQYQIQKVTRVTAGTTDVAGPSVNEASAPQKTEDSLSYRPNPDLLVGKGDTNEDGNGLYRPPKFAPTTMEEDKMSKQEKNDKRKEKEFLRRSKQSSFVREMIDDMEGRPEEVREGIGAESREHTRDREKWEDRARREEELFTRAPLTKMEKKREKNLKKSRNGLLDITENFYDEVKTLGVGDDLEEESTGFRNGGSKKGKFKKHKRKR